MLKASLRFSFSNYNKSFNLVHNRNGETKLINAYKGGSGYNKHGKEDQNKKTPKQKF